MMYWRVAAAASLIMADLEKPTAHRRFQPGDKVRVKSGVTDPDFEDLPLDGWTGTIRKVHPADGDTRYEIALDRRTVSNIHPIYFKRCERDGLDPNTMGLGEESIEPDDGTPVPIEQPTAIRTRPLSMEDQDDRLRAAFGLTHDDPLPKVKRESQLTYYRSLLTHLTFPFPAKYWKRTGAHSSKLVRLTVTGLYDMDQYEVEEGYGLIGVGKDPSGEAEFPLIEIEDIEDQANRRLIEDYSYWMSNWR
jgi:hypothetical protein